MDRLIIMDGDEPMEVANRFCDQHDLSEKKRKKLKTVIKQQLTGMLTRIEEGDEEGEEEEDDD